MRPPLHDPQWLPMKEAIEARERKAGSIFRAVTDLEEAMRSGKLRVMHRDLATGKRERVKPTFWQDHEIDVMPGTGSVVIFRRSDERPADRPRRWGDFDHYPDVRLDGYVFFFWELDFVALFGSIVALKR